MSRFCQFFGDTHENGTRLKRDTLENGTQLKIIYVLNVQFNLRFFLETDLEQSFVLVLSKTLFLIYFFVGQTEQKMTEIEESDLSDLSNYEQTDTEDENDEDFINPLPYENFPTIIDIGKQFLLSFYFVKGQNVKNKKVPGSQPGSLDFFWLANGLLFYGHRRLRRNRPNKKNQIQICCYRKNLMKCKASIFASCTVGEGEVGYTDPENWTVKKASPNEHIKISTDPNVIKMNARLKTTTNTCCNQPRAKIENFFFRKLLKVSFEQYSQLNIDSLAKNCR